MTHIILFTDNPDASADLRQQHMQAHLSFLEENADKITAAGPLHTSNGTAAGGIWITTTDTAAQAEALVKADPFWPTGLRASYDILKWTQVFKDGSRQI